MPSTSAKEFAAACRRFVKGLTKKKALAQLVAAGIVEKKTGRLTKRYR